MKRHIGIFLAGVAVIAPVAVTVYVVYWVASLLIRAGGLPLGDFGQTPLGGLSGLVLGVALVYVVGALTHVWVFRKAISLMERLLDRVPGVKTIYGSVRDLMALFGKGSERMGKVVEYHPPGMSATLLGVLTNENPPGIPGAGGEGGKVAVYLPFGYMIGGVTVYVPRDQLRELDMPVEQALKLAATAHVTPPSDEPRPAPPPVSDADEGKEL